jgi:cell division protein FtsL
MNPTLVEKIADAVLYEGYILYPYRPSAVKNQQRWNFGALCPESYSVARRGTESWTMQTECLVCATQLTTLNLKVRFLHLLTREVMVPVPITDLKSQISDLKSQNSDRRSQISDLKSESSDLTSQISDLRSQISEHEGQTSDLKSQLATLHFQLVPSLEVNGKLFQTWQEAIEREVRLPEIALGRESDQSYELTFSFPATETIEELRDAASGQLPGVLVRKQQEIRGAVQVRISECGMPNGSMAGSAESNPKPEIGKRNAGALFKITVQILNQTPLENAEQRSRDDALMRSFVSTHTILNAQNGDFVSLLDPPEAFREAAESCTNLGTYPVLAGEEGHRNWMLSSPIILYDYPQIAPESAGNLYDGTEIDEILTLRIMTLTEEEKREMRGADDRARLILERTESLPMEQLMKMHGAMKSVKPKGP